MRVSLLFATVLAAFGAPSAGAVTLKVEATPTLTVSGVPVYDGGVIAAVQERARDLIRRMRDGGIRTESVHVVIPPGEYVVGESLKFDARDSGASSDLPVVYEAEKSGTVLISGAWPVLGAPTDQKKDPRVVVFSDSRLRASHLAGGGQFFVNGQRQTLAREPNLGRYWFVKQPVASATDTAANAGSKAFSLYPESVGWLARLSDASRGRAVVNIFQSWTADKQYIDSIDEKKGVVELAVPGRFAFLRFGTDQRLFVENVPEALDAVGEWVAIDGGVRFLKGEDPVSISKKLVGRYPHIDKILTIRGNAESSQRVSNIRFSGLGFAFTRALVPAGGFRDSQAAEGVGAAIEVDNADNIVFEGCEVSHTGGNAIWLRDRVARSSVIRTKMIDLGAGGIKIGMTRADAASPDNDGHNVVKDNFISDTGQVYPGGVGIWIGRSFSNSIENNTIARTSYSAISVGWQWGYGGPTSGRNLIQSNLIFDVGSELSDLGAIYLLGEAPGTVVRENVIRDVRAYPWYGPGAWGIYADEGTSSVLFEKNVVVGTDSGAFHLHFGRENIVNSNIFSNGLQADLRVTRTDGQRVSVRADGNVFASESGSVLRTIFGKSGVILKNNFIKSRAESVGAAQKSCGESCISRSVSITTGVAPRDISLVGFEGPEQQQFSAVIAAAGSASYRSEERALASRHSDVVAGPPVALDFEAEKWAVGSLPFGFKFATGESRKRTAVKSESSKPEVKCLSVDGLSSRDEDRLDAVYLVANHRSGRSVLDIRIKALPETSFRHEWRDDPSEPRVGPAFEMAGRTISVAGKRLIDVTPNGLVSITLEAGLSGDSSPWRVEVVDLSTGRRTTSLQQTDGTRLKSLRWLGFMPVGGERMSMCLSRLSLVNNASR